MNKRKNCKKDTITVMCDYSADGLWFNGYAISASYKRLPKIIHLMGNRIEKWQEQYERFQFYNIPYEDVKRLEKTIIFQRWLKEGFSIAKKIKRIVGNKYKVEYFDERTSERIKIK